MISYEFVAQHTEPDIKGPGVSQGFGRVLLLHNARWFTRVRWFVVAPFVVLGLAGHFIPGFLLQCGIVPPRLWPWAIAGILLAANAYFCVALKRMDENAAPRAVEVNLWFQIAVDLFCVTILVHEAGSVNTFAAFLYLFHIVLACVFFSRGRSLLVVGLAAAFYFACVALETTGTIRQSCILAGFPAFDPSNRLLPAVQAGSAVAVWMGVWYLAATLSEIVRKSEREIEATNVRLLKADQEKNQMVLRTAHDLKAPFSGIEMNIETLRNDHWAETPPSVRDIIARIEVRAAALRARIRDILTLGGLRAQVAPASGPPAGADLKVAVESAVQSLEETAGGRNVAVNVKVPSAPVRASREQLSMIFSNIIGNAITYSREGGIVDVSAEEGPDAVQVSVTDRGIGIREDALPHIFEEYYRTAEGARFNSMSTGLGLAIVKEVAGQLGARIRVESECGVGTTFKISLQKARAWTKQKGDTTWPG